MSLNFRRDPTTDVARRSDPKYVGRVLSAMVSYRKTITSHMRSYVCHLIEASQNTAGGYSHPHFAHTELKAPLS